jgi:hypothetical protein
MAGAGGGSASATSNTAKCASLSFSTGITITKSCSSPATGVPGGAFLVAQNGVVEVEVGVSGTVTNSDTGGLPLSSVTVYDCVGGGFAAIPPPSSTNPCPTVSPNTCTGTLRSTVTYPASSTINASNSSAWGDTYFPSVAPTCGPYNFTDQVLVSASCTSKFCACSTVQNESQVATCPLCPGPMCP